jgi:hypothetical protein
MRAYKFLDAHFGLKCLYEKRLKISTINDLNDPFELIPFNLADKNLRRALQKTRDHLAARRGLLCFSAEWGDPVIWAHYSDKHRGICIGFEIPDDADVSRRVKYVSQRLPFPPGPTIAHAEAMLFTKYSNWACEQEIRMLATLSDEEDGRYFYDFDNKVRVTEIIAGARCTLPKSALTRALGPLAEQITVIKARAGFRKFEIVQDKRGFKPGLYTSPKK